ncbi:hypothetical protein SAMN04490244_101538 [Tranquillimonas rosea]|uniref:DUF2155 domain-containing protein n=1 Tax=Tranquillimonas rosea TaxID=641238 RepID=A0A1H9QC95_9RHOB|nr:DUF2155 domain-containing protein [Tranquillimonas rosea]SER57509.1 hypothetical protein SAMN04490244_101538 [Tranquillimonas rosea]
MMRPLLLALAFAAGPAPAQFVDENTTQENVRAAQGATLRGLDKLSGEAQDIQLGTGETRSFGSVQITLGECRYPADNPAGNAYAYLVIRDAGVEEPAFKGWMVASSPALNALEHSRYDVWVLRCNT